MTYLSFFFFDKSYLSSYMGVLTVIRMYSFCPREFLSEKEEMIKEKGKRTTESFHETDNQVFDKQSGKDQKFLCKRVN